MSAKIRLATPGWDTYTGYLGMTQFVDGKSVEAVPQHFINRIAGQMKVVEITEDGEKVAGLAEAALTVGSISATLTAPLPRASDLELAAEQTRLEAEALNSKGKVVLSRTQLEAIASEKGIGGLREIAKPWGVKDRSIPGLIDAIATAQAAYVERKKNADAARAGERAAQTRDGVLVQSASPDTTPNAIAPDGSSIFVAPPVLSAAALVDAILSAAPETPPTEPVEPPADPVADPDAAPASDEAPSTETAT